LKKSIYFLLFIWSFRGAGQSQGNFTLVGNINADSGMISLYGSGDITIYPKDFNFSPVPVKDGKFQLTGKISDPCQVILILRIGDKPTYISGSFFIERGMQTIKCNVDSLRKVPDIRNSTMFEYLNEYCSSEYQSIATNQDYYFRNTLYRNYLHAYASKHSESYVALWEVARMLKDGYDEQSDSAFEALSNTMKISGTGMLLQDELSHLRMTKTGAEFPKMNTFDLLGKSQDISQLYLHSKYTLVDFWFAHCTACISQFPDYIKIFSEYQQKGFTIIGISNDTSKNDIKSWKEIIKNKSLNWHQYRVTRVATDDLRIVLFPANFLLDGSGKIVASNIDTKQLADFLQDKLK
jgi:thiol-disulfide isomerase/thioredoxin